MVKGDGKSSIYTMMVDGPLDAATVKQMVEVLDGSASEVFATGDRQGKNPRLEIRFVD